MSDAYSNMDADTEYNWTDSIKLILRRLEDMTPEDFNSISNQLSVSLVSAVAGGPIGYSDHPRYVLVIANRLQTNTLTFNDGIILMKMGFDLFGLIDAGLAVDIKTLPK